MKTMIEEMVSRFLGWKLPANFAPDAGMKFVPGPLQQPDGPYWPSGTNLLDATQARQMFEHCMSTMWKPIGTAPKDGTAILALLHGSDIPYPIRWNVALERWMMTWDHHLLAAADGPRCWTAIPDGPNSKPSSLGD